MSDWTVTQAGTVIDGWDIKGCLYIRAANVIVRNSRIACNNYNVIDVRGPNGATVVPNANLLVEDSDIIVSGYGNNGISWTGYTLRRVHITATGSDCASANEGVVIEDSFCEIIGKVRSDPVTTLPGSPHPDGFQETGSSRNVTIRHNTISNPFMVVSAIMQDGGTSNIRIVNNLVAGGGYTLYCPANRSALVEFSGNVVSRVYNQNGGTWGVNYRDQCPNSGWRWDV